MEFSCPTIGHVAPNLVWYNQYLRSSDNQWVYVASGNKYYLVPPVPGAQTGGHIEWCYRPQSFEYWLNELAPNPNCV